jgi:very-short-patch-repair endonuclease
MSEIPRRPTADLWAKLKPIAREMRGEPTRAEQALWQRLRNRQCGGAKFRRQHTIDRFIVDFVCHEHMLIIEVDGEIHQFTQEEDHLRQAFLETFGFRFLRFTNEQVLGDLESVVGRILKEIGK